MPRNQAREEFTALASDFQLFQLESRMDFVEVGAWFRWFSAFPVLRVGACVCDMGFVPMHGVFLEGVVRLVVGGACVGGWMARVLEGGWVADGFCCCGKGTLLIHWLWVRLSGSRVMMGWSDGAAKELGLEIGLCEGGG